MIEITKKNIRIWSMLGMRRIVGPALEDIADYDENLMFCTADLGRYFAFEDFKRKYPNKVVDFGIAEQNMIGASSALQNEGFHVFAATYATFITSRVLDQIRVNIGMMNLGVKLVGAAGGLSDGNFSATHMALEDIAVLRAIPNMSIIAPADGMELVKALVALDGWKGAAYLRLTGRANIPIIYKKDYSFEIGKSVCIKDGSDMVIISNGTILRTCLDVAEELEIMGINCKVINMHTIKPLDTTLLDEIQNYPLVVTVEEHMRQGGLGSAIAEYYAEKKIRPCQKIIAVEGNYPEANEYECLLKRCGLTKEGIKTSILSKYNEIQ